MQDLMRAAEAALATKTAKETKIREIAAAAGTHEAMIHYYFGGKDGLMVALFQDVMKDAPHTRYKVIAQACIEQKSIKPLVKQLVKFFYSRPNLIRMTIAEMIAGSSKVKSAYHDRYSEATPKLIEYVLTSMIEFKIYGQDINVDFVGMSITGMVVAPLLPPAEALEMLHKFDNPEWIDYIAQTIDRSLKPRPWN